MKNILAILLFPLALLAQKTVDDFAVKTNLTTGTFSITSFTNMDRGVVTDSSNRFVQSVATRQQVDRAAMNVATIADARLLTTNLNDRQQVLVGGYATDGDGGGGDFRYDASDTTSVDNGGTILVGTVSGIRLKRIVDGPVNVKAWGAVGDGVSDNLTALRKAVTNTPNLYFPAGTYNVSDSVSIPSNLVVRGEAANTTSIVGTSTNFIFTFQAPADGSDDNTGLSLSDITLSGKNCIKFSDGTNGFASQRQILQGNIQNVYFVGRYSAGSDTNANTSVPPTESELLSYGVGIYGTKWFDWYVRNVQVQYFGIGAYMVGCDINDFDNNRFAYNARHFHFVRVDTFGNQNKVQNSDLLLNYRLGAIYDNNWWTSVKDNYFETYSAAGQFVIAENTVGSLFWGNRIDSNATNTPLLSLAPKYDHIVSNNRYNPNSTNATITVLPTYWDPSFQTLVKFTGNADTFPATRWPQCQYDDYSSPRIWDAWSPKTATGLLAQTYFWSTNAVTGLPCATGIDTLIVTFPTFPTDRDLLVQISGVSVSGSPGFISATWGGVSVLSETLGITGTNILTTVVKTVRRPVSVLPTDSLRFELVTSETAYQGIGLTPTNYQLLEAAPTTGTWSVGDQVVKRTPVVGQPKGWSCTVSGTPGTWVSIGNL